MPGLQRILFPLESIHTITATRPLSAKIFLSFNTEVDKVNPDNSISYYSQIYNQTKIALMEQRDIEQVWNETIEKTKSQVSNPSFVIAIDCINRIKLLEKEDKIEQYKDFLTKNYNNFICLSGYGEQLNYMQLNMSFILAIFE